ncbi:MAG: ParA family protein [Oscillospiraceae bacterium]
MKTIAITNIKGGVGKTISTVNIGAVLAQKDFRVLIVDLDPQANATQILKCYKNEGVTINEIFLEKNIETQTAIVKTEHNNLDLIPANINFAFAESKIIVDTTRQQQTRLKKALAQISNNYDYCLLDCPPNIGIVTINALACADEVIVPIKIDQFALDGLDYLIQTILEIKSEFNEKLNFLGSFVTMDNNTGVNKTVKIQLENTEILQIFKSTIPTNVKVAESTFNQMPVVYTDKQSKATIGYNALTEELLERERLI